MRTRNAFMGMAVGCALIASQAHAAEPAPPPAEWADYVAQVRKADSIQDDEARCLAYPDLPGNQWRPGAARGRCSILRKPAMSLDEIDALLASPDGVAELDRRFAALLDAHYQQPEQREQIFNAFEVFDESERAAKVAERWLKAAPKSAFANTAMGAHYSEAGWKARGTRWASETPDENFKRMTENFGHSVPLYLEALKIEPRLSVACYRLAGVGRNSSDALQQFALARCTKVDPDSYFVALEHIDGAEPRWGGSDEQLRSAVAYAAARTERNPALGALLGEAAGYRPKMADDLGPVADDLAAAVRMGPSGSLFRSAGLGYRRNRQTWEAYAYLSQAVRFRPGDGDFWYWRSLVLSDMVHDVVGARSDIQRALALDPEDDSYLYQLGRIVNQAEGYVAARPHFKRAMKGESREQAMQQYCLSFLIPQVEAQADTCTREWVTEYPSSVGAWRTRAFYLLRFGATPEEALQAFAQFERMADGTASDQAALKLMREELVPVVKAAQAKGGKGAMNGKDS